MYLRAFDFQGVQHGCVFLLELFKVCHTIHLLRNSSGAEGGGSDRAGFVEHAITPRV